MGNISEFKSVLSKELGAFVYEYHVKGFKNRSVFETLRMLDKFLYTIEYKDKSLKPETYQEWLESMKGVCASTLYDRACIVRRFIKYLNAIGYECKVPLLPRRYSGDYTPYVFSHDEMNQIFAECDKYIDKHSFSYSSTIMFPAVVRILYSTGMRIGEALSIKNKDVDFKNHIIKLTQTKNGKERLCAINESLEAVLQQYIGYRDRLPYENLNAPDAFFFVGTHGKRTKVERIWQRFHNVLVKLDIKDHINGGYPRLHDLRHTACVHAMKKLIESGKDIYCYVGVLSAFLGHVKTSDTEHYIRLTKELYPDLIQKDAVVTAAVHSVIKRSLIVKDI